VVERFGAAGVPKDRVALARDTYTFEYPAPPSELVAAFRNYYGPTMNAFEAAAKTGREGELDKELNELFARENRTASKDKTSIPATFLRVTVTR
jgi:hypothetical protein